MKFVVKYEYRGANYVKIVKGGWAVWRLKQRYHVYSVTRY